MSTAKNWIFTGSHNLRLPSGELIEPFQTFHAPQKWREKFGPTAIGRRIVLITDYEEHWRHPNRELRHMLNEFRRRDLRPDPVDTSDAQWLVRPHTTLELIREGRELEVLKRYDLDHKALLEMDSSAAFTTIRRAVTAYILDDLGMTIGELKSALVDTLMAPFEVADAA